MREGEREKKRERASEREIVCASAYYQIKWGNTTHNKDICRNALVGKDFKLNGFVVDT